MFKIFDSRNDRRQLFDFYFVGVTVLLYIFRTAIPFLKYPFLLLYPLLIIYLFYNYRHSLVNSLKEFIKVYYLALILTLILLFSFILSNKIYLIVFKDVINSLLLLSFSYILILTLNSKREIDEFVNILINLFIAFALLISLYRLFDLLNIIVSKNSTTLYQIPYVIESGSLSVDYNFATLPVFFGMISILYFMLRDISFIRRFIYTILLTIFSISIFFAGSRRGLIVFFLIIFLILVSQIFVFAKRSILIKKVAENTRPFILAFALIIISSLFVTLKTSYDFKNRTLELLGSKNLVRTKGDIALTFFKYMSIFNHSLDYPSVYNSIWTPVFNPNDPDSGWGSRIHKTEYPLTGANVEIVPKGAKGYYLDHSTNADTINGNAYSSSWLISKNVDENMILEASVYCFISENCDISSAMICSLGAMGNPGALYDLNNKGKWQRLEFSINCVKGNAGVLLFFSKTNAQDFSSIGGYLIFAYPSVNLISKEKNTSLNDYKNCSRNSAEKINCKSATPDYFNSPTVMIENNSEKLHYSNLNLFSFIIKLPESQLKKQNDNDPIRDFVSRIISEDTTYHNFKSNLVVNNGGNNFVLGRTLRWKFAWEIYSKEFNIREKIIGGGFKFLNWYGNYFLNDKRKSDYPHNPLFSILLYSGILGLAVYLIFIYYIILYYTRYFTHYPLIVIFSIITFFFSFFSSGSPFDPPILGFFSTFPLLINKYYRKE